MAGNKPTQLTAPQDSAPVLENDGDIFAPLRRVAMTYAFHVSRFRNLITTKRSMLETADKDNKPALHSLLKRLEGARDYYQQAATASDRLLETEIA